MRALLVALTALTLISPTLDAAELSVIGAWTLNRDLTTIPESDDPRRPPEGNRRGGFGGGGGRGGGGIGGGVGGGIGGRGLGGFGGGNGPSEDELHKVEVIRRRLGEVPMRLLITRNGDNITIVDELGRSYTLKADGKKQERVTGDGEFTSKTRFEAAKLVVEEDFGGPKLITTYTPVLEGGELLRLEVIVKADNMPGAARERLEARRGAGGRGGPPEVRRVYNAEAK
jgi:hypothetical protein